MNQLPRNLRTWLSRRVVACLVLLLVTLGTYHTASANELDGVSAKLLPKTVIAFAEIHHLGETAEMILNHPLREKLSAMPAYASVLKSDNFGKLKLAVNAFEGAMKQPWQEALKTLTDGGIALALDSSDGGVALLVKSSDHDAIRRFHEFLLALRLLGGEPTEPAEYRGFKVDTIGDDFRIALVDNRLILTNKSEFGKAIIDLHVDGGNDSLYSNERFRNAFHQRAGADHPAVLGFLDIEAVRNAGMAKDLFDERIDNFLGELVLGGLLANVRHTPYATLQLEVQREGLQLQLTTPHERSWESPREYYFGAPAHATAPSLLAVKDRLFALSSHRDMSQMWLRSGDLLSERASDELAKADTQLTTFFSGRDFGEDILGSLEGAIQLVGSGQDFAGRLPRPAIQLPAFAIQLKMKDPDATRPELRRVFQSFVGFLNIIGAMNGQPQFDLGTESVFDATLHTATYVADIDERESVTAPINFNFSPTLAFVSDYVILSSTIPLARELAGRRGERPDRDLNPEPALNTAAVLNAQVLQQILKVNQSQLVANSMLEKGHSKESAEAEVGLLLDLLGFLQDAQLRLNVSDSQLQLTVGLNVDGVHGRQSE